MASLASSDDALSGVEEQLRELKSLAMCLTPDALRRRVDSTLSALAASVNASVNAHSQPV